MKILLICALSLTGFGGLLSHEAQAGGSRYRSEGYDSRYSERSHRSYRSYRSYDYCEPRYYSYRRPVRVYHDDRDECYSRGRSYRTPLLSFHLGF